MEIFWLILSIIIGLFSFCVFYAVNKIKNGDQQTWDDACKQFNKMQSVDVPEEVIYEVVLKVRKLSAVILCICLFVAAICIYSLIIH